VLDIGSVQERHLEVVCGPAVCLLNVTIRLAPDVWISQAGSWNRRRWNWNKDRERRCVEEHVVWTEEISGVNHVVVSICEMRLFHNLPAS
jgi:hypothetical protein